MKRTARPSGILCTLVPACLCFALPALAADPVVEDVVFFQRTDGSKLVDITYDVSDADGDNLTIAVAVSDDGGLTWNVPCRTLSGDVGDGIAPGPGKFIIWDFGQDDPDWEGETYLLRVLASDAGVYHRTHSPDNYWIMEWGAVDWSDDRNVEQIAKADVAVLGAVYLWGNETNENLQVIDRIKAVNPDCVVLGYVLPKTIMLWWENSASFPYGRDMFDRTRPFWSYTTTGDTLMDFSQQVVINILDPACRDSIVTTITQAQLGSANRLDGVFWDYFNDSIWIHPNVEDQVEGFPDMDGNGIAQHLDSAERIAYRQACVDLVQAVRDSLGESFIQVFNGQRAYDDSAFAALSDGLYYELFPTLFFPAPPMASALDPDYEYSLFHVPQWCRTVNGGPYVVLGNIRQNFYYDHNFELQTINLGDHYRVVALLTDTYTTWIAGGHHYDWTGNEINLGPPLGSTQIDGDTYTRDFRYGRVELIIESGTYPNPFDYRIWVNGTLVEEWNFPYHFP